MAYLVKLMPRAERDLERLYADIQAVDSEQARHWYLGFTSAILNLRQMPKRNPATPEKRSLRHLLYGTKPHVYRAIYRVLPKRVEVLHIRHGARREFTRQDLL